MCARTAERGERGLGGQHAGLHRVVRALDPRQVHEAGRAADQRAAGKRQSRHGLETAFVDRARAVREPLAAFERRTNRRMQLEPLELVVRRKMRIRVVQMHDEADGDEVVAEVIDERAAAGRRIERPSLAVHDEPFPVLFGLDLPQLLDADAVFLRIDAVAKVESLHQRLRQRPAAAFREQRVPRVQLHSLLVFGLVRAVLRNPHVARRDAAHVTAVAVQHFGRGKARVDFDAERLRLLREPATDVAEAHDVIAMVAHQRRQQALGYRERLVMRQDQEPVFADRRIDRRAQCLPIGHELVQRARIDDGAGQDVRADLRALFENAHRDFARRARGELLQPDRRGESGGTSADDHHVVFHHFARHRHQPRRANARRARRSVNYNDLIA